MNIVSGAWKKKKNSRRDLTELAADEEDPVASKKHKGAGKKGKYRIIFFCPTPHRLGLRNSRALYNSGKVYGDKINWKISELFPTEVDNPETEKQADEIEEDRKRRENRLRREKLVRDRKEACQNNQNESVLFFALQIGFIVIFGTN
jgi:hypothetical protein